jgi:hypothetical protein
MTSKTRVVVIGTGCAGVRLPRRPHRADGPVIAYDTFAHDGSMYDGSTYGRLPEVIGAPARTRVGRAQEERAREEAEPLPSAGGPLLHLLTNDGGS